MGQHIWRDHFDGVVFSWDGTFGGTSPTALSPGLDVMYFFLSCNLTVLMSAVANPHFQSPVFCCTAVLTLCWHNLSVFFSSVDLLFSFATYYGFKGTYTYTLLHLASLCVHCTMLVFDCVCASATSIIAHQCFPRSLLGLS